MYDLPADTLLQRADDLPLRLDAEGVRISIGGAEQRFGPHALAVLDAFAQPRVVDEAIQSYRNGASDAADRAAFVTTLCALYRAGVLRGAERAEEATAPPRRGWAAAGPHIHMLDDRDRVERYIQAIRQTVRPGDVVLDIGTGTGVLAVAAAQAGARHVYAVEASAIAPMAEAVFRANGLADRITVIRGWSTEISLPERADVMVSELLGDNPLSEAVLEVTQDASDRLLVPGARMVPQRLAVRALPVTVPQDQIALRVFLPETVEDWRRWYGIDFSALLESDGTHAVRFYADPMEARTWTTLGDPVLLGDWDLREIGEIPAVTTAVVPARREGEVNGVAVFFDLELAPGVDLTTDPGYVSHTNHWRNLVWLLPTSLPVKPGTPLRYHYNVSGSGPRGQVKVAVE